MKTVEFSDEESFLKIKAQAALEKTTIGKLIIESFKFRQEHKK